MGYDECVVLLPYFYISWWRQRQMDCLNCGTEMTNNQVTTKKDD